MTRTMTTQKAALALWQRRLAYRKARVHRGAKWRRLHREAEVEIDKIQTWIARETPRKDRRVGRNCVNLVAEFEGFRSRPYTDVGGVWTIGYGETRGIGPHTAPWSEAQARAVLQLRLVEFGREVNKLLKRGVTQNQFDALVSFAYNLGIGALKSSTLLKHVNAGKRMAAADEFKKWINAAGRPQPGLVRRRKAERALFLRRG